MRHEIPTRNWKGYLLMMCFMAAAVISLVVFITASWNIFIKSLIIFLLLLVTGGIFLLTTDYQFEDFSKFIKEQLP